MMEYKRMFNPELHSVTFGVEHMLRMLDNPKTKVYFYPYRTCRLNVYLVSLPRGGVLETEKLEAKLISRAEYATEITGYKSTPCQDNHTLYHVVLEDGTDFGIFCHDIRMYIGFGLNVGIW